MIRPSFSNPDRAGDMNWGAKESGRETGTALKRRAAPANAKGKKKIPQKNANGWPKDITFGTASQYGKDKRRR